MSETTETTTAAADTTAETTAETTTETTAPDWLSLLDDDGKKYVEGKGYKSPADALAALKGYEPPETADGYEIPVPEGESPDFAKSVAPLMHKAQLSAAQAKALAEGWNEMQTANRKAAEAAEANAETEAKAIAERQAGELKREWGDAHDAKLEGARRAARSFTPGKDEAAKEQFLTAMERQFGYDGMMRFWASVGDHMSEDKAHGLGGKHDAPATSFYDKSNMNP